MNLEKIKELLKETTPGKWQIVFNGHAADCRPAIIGGELLRIHIDKSENFGDPYPDAEFIAQSKEIVTFLLGEVERLYDKWGVSEALKDQAVKNKEYAELLLKKCEERVKELEDQ